MPRTAASPGSSRCRGCSTPGRTGALAEKIDGMTRFRKDLGLDGQGDGLGRDAPVAVVGGDGEAINEPGDRPCVGGVLE